MPKNKKTLWISALFVASTLLWFNKSIISNAIADNTSLLIPVPATAQNGYSPIKTVEAARSQIGNTIQYDPEYTALPYPNGDVPMYKGVCTDVVIRAMRHQGIDLQKNVHEDMKKHFSKYPTRWGLKKPDTNIDHRRVLNLEVYMTRQGANLPLTDFQAGDLVTWRVGDKQLPHIGIVSDKRTFSGTPLIIHNIGRGTAEEDVLQAFQMVGHYRWKTISDR